MSIRELAQRFLAWLDGVTNSVLDYPIPWDGVIQWVIVIAVVWVLYLIIDNILERRKRKASQ